MITHEHTKTMTTLLNGEDKLFKDVGGITEEPSNPLWSHSGPHDLLTKQCPACHKTKLALFTNFLEVGSPLTPDKGLSERCLQCIALERGLMLEETAATEGPVWGPPKDWTPDEVEKFRHSSHIHKEILKDGQVLIALDELNHLPWDTGPRQMKKLVKKVAQEAMNDDSILGRIQPASGVTFYKILGLLVKRDLVAGDYQQRTAEEPCSSGYPPVKLYYGSARKKNFENERRASGEEAQEAAEAEPSAAGASAKRQKTT